jgi:nucleoside-diphosphate-sugar epimerase
MQILVTGDRGYIGSVLVPFLREAGHAVDGLDLDLYEGCDLGPGPKDAGMRRAQDKTTSGFRSNSQIRRPR